MRQKGSKLHFHAHKPIYLIRNDTVFGSLQSAVFVLRDINGNFQNHFIEPQNNRRPSLTDVFYPHLCFIELDG